FERLWVQPAAGDAGGALGAALAVWHSRAKESRPARDSVDDMQGALLGPDFTDAEIEATLRANQAVYEQLDEQSLIARTVELLQQEKVVGWVHGRGEFGPRALGN